MSSFNNFVNNIVSLKKSEQYSKVLETFKKEKHNFNSIEAENINSKNIIEELKKYWRSQISKGKEKRLTGIIKKILHDNDKGKNGFLTSDNVDYYFTLPIHLDFTKDIKINSEVNFVSIKQASGKIKAKIIKVNN